MFNSITKTIHFAHLGILFIYGLTAGDLCNHYAKYSNAEELCLNFKANICVSDCVYKLTSGSWKSPPSVFLRI